MLRKILLGIVGASLFATGASAQSATSPRAIVVASCGTIPSAPPVGSFSVVYIDQTGKLCTASSSGGGGATTIANGADVTQGTINDTHVQGTVVGFLKDMWTALTTGPVPVSAASLPLPAGASIATKQPAIGTAGTPSVDVLTIQGIAGGTPMPVTQSVGTTFAPSQISLSTTAAQVLATLAAPSARQVCNIDTAIVEYIGASGVTSSTGIPINPGTCWDMSGTTAAVFAVAASATPKVAVVQY